MAGNQSDKELPERKSVCVLNEKTAHLYADRNDFYWVILRTYFVRIMSTPNALILKFLEYLLSSIEH